jgi:hypothetical protein
MVGVLEREKETPMSLAPDEEGKTGAAPPGKMGPTRWYLVLNLGLILGSALITAVVVTIAVPQAKWARDEFKLRERLDKLGRQQNALGDAIEKRSAVGEGFERWVEKNFEGLDQVSHKMDNVKGNQEELQANIALLWEHVAWLQEHSPTEAGHADPAVASLWPTVDKEFGAWVRLWARLIPGFSPATMAAAKEETLRPEALDFDKETKAYIHLPDHCLTEPERGRCLFLDERTGRPLMLVDREKRQWLELLSQSPYPSNDAGWLGPDTIVIADWEISGDREHHQLVKPRLRILSVASARVAVFLGPEVEWDPWQLMYSRYWTGKLNR